MRLDAGAAEIIPHFATISYLTQVNYHPWAHPYTTFVGIPDIPVLPKEHDCVKTLQVSRIGPDIRLAFFFGGVETMCLASPMRSVVHKEGGRRAAHGGPVAGVQESAGPE